MDWKDDLMDLDLDDDLQDSEEDEFGDDIDLDELVEVVETVEQQHASANGQISFVSSDEDPEPPPALPASTECFHPFDPENLRTWIYPINYPIRGYQLNIVRKAMFSNTLVALPTGLGKTFIAAVVMFNYWRWFPNSKIIFMAPTRPLVDQQIQACHSICGIPQSETQILTGTLAPAKRGEQWKSKRVFFATPQTVQKDIETKICPIKQVSCVVLDEAHKATGNYAYTEVVRKLYQKNKEFRILALTATPGSTLDAVQSVIDHLHINNVQIRTEDSMDIREFSHGKHIQRIIVKLGYTEGSTGLLPRVINDYVNKVFEPMLVDLSRKPTGISPSVERVTSFGLNRSRNYFNANAKNLNSSMRYYIQGAILVAESACRSYEYLCNHGIGPFVESIESTFAGYKEIEDSGKKLSRAQSAFYHHSALNGIIRQLKAELQRPDFIGHPKMDRLVSILLDHFSSTPPGESSKVMIFSSYRSSVVDICNVLDRHRPIIRSTVFVGQATDKQGVKGLKQAEQREVIQRFKKDEYNVLVATSIGEEGLDIGEVDLIVCFDAQASPIRMLQRMGRTGRKRRGKCIILMTEAEEKRFNQAEEAYTRIQQLITRGNNLTYYPTNPSVIPQNYKPALCRKKLHVTAYVAPPTSTRKRNRAANIAMHIDYTPEGFLTPEAKQIFVRSFCDRDHNYTNMRDIENMYWPIQRTHKSIDKFIPLQTQPQTTYRVGHSKRTLQLTEIISKMEHRIVFPEDEAGFSIQMPTIQTKLKLPSKATLSKKAPVNKAKRFSGPLEDDDLDDFLANNDISQFIDLPEQNELILPSKKQKDKGKSKMTKSQELREAFANSNDDNHGDFEDQMKQDFDDEDSPSWDPILPPSVYDDIEPLPDLYSFEKMSPSPDSLRPSPIVSSENPKEAKKPSPIEIDLDSDIPNNQMSISSMPSPVAAKPFDNSDDWDDEFDISIDAALLAQAEALAIAKETPGFDDPLEPMLAFEKNSNDVYLNHAVTIVWDNAPPFSEKGLELLEKRQSALQKATGRRVTMSTIRSLRPPPPLPVPSLPPASSSPPPASSSSPSFAPLREKQTEAPKPIVLQDAQPQPKDNGDEFDDDDGFDFDFSEGGLANFLENKVGEDDMPHSLPFMYGINEQEEEEAPAVVNKSFMYTGKSFSPPKRRHQRFQDTIGADEKVIEIDLDDFSDSSESNINDPEPEQSAEMKPDTPEKQDVAEKQNTLEKQDDVNKQDLPEKQDIGEAQPPLSENQSIIQQPSPLGHDEVGDPSNSKQQSPLRTNDDDNKSVISIQSDSISEQFSQSPLIKKRRRRKVVISEDEQDSPVGLLSTLSKGMYTPSPLRPTASGSTSPAIVLKRRKKKRPVVNNGDSSDEFPLTKRLKRLPTTIQEEDEDEDGNNGGDDDDDEEDIVISAPSRADLLRRLKQSKDKNYSRSTKHAQRREDGFMENPFIYHEAEKSSDEGHTDDDLEGDEMSSAMNSFIDDNSSVGHSRLSVDEDEQQTGYVQSLLQQGSPQNKRHWMNKFDAEKWLNTNPEDDSIVVTEEEEEEEDLESIQDFTSDDDFA